MSGKRNRSQRCNLQQRKQVMENKCDGELLLYLKSLTFIKNTLIGGINCGFWVVIVFQNDLPNWLYYPIAITFLLFPFAKVMMERIGLHFAPASFWKKHNERAMRIYIYLDFYLWLLITLLAVPLAAAYFIRLMTKRERR